MSDLVGTQIDGFPTRRLKYLFFFIFGTSIIIQWCLQDNFNEDAVNEL